MHFFATNHTRTRSAAFSPIGQNTAERPRSFAVCPSAKTPQNRQLYAICIRQKYYVFSLSQTAHSCADVTNNYQASMKTEEKKIAKQTDPEILEKLRNYKKTETCFCLECGYDGLMGFEKNIFPWYLSWWFIIILIISGIGIIPACLLGLWRAFSEKSQVVCPNCDSTLRTQ